MLDAIRDEKGLRVSCQAPLVILYLDQQGDRAREP